MQQQQQQSQRKNNTSPLWFRSIHPFHGEQQSPQQQYLSFEAGAWIVVADHQKANVHGWAWGFVHHRSSRNGSSASSNNISSSSPSKKHRQWGWFPVNYVQPTTAPTRHHRHVSRPKTSHSLPTGKVSAPSPTSIADDLWNTTMGSNKTNTPPLQTPHLTAATPADPALAPWKQQQPQSMAFDPFANLSGTKTATASSPYQTPPLGSNQDTLLSLVSNTSAATTASFFPNTTTSPINVSPTSTTASSPTSFSSFNNNHGSRAISFHVPPSSSSKPLNQEDDEEEFGFGSEDMILGGTSWRGGEGVSTSRGFGNRP